VVIVTGEGVWDGMFPGEQERVKKIISGEEDWIIWRVKTTKGEQGEWSGGSGNGQTTTRSFVVCVLPMVLKHDTVKPSLYNT
jgi:hypothetical protein